MAEPATYSTTVPAVTGAAVAGGLFALDPDVLFWALWGVLAVGGTMVIFALREIPAALGRGGTLSEIVEDAIAARPVLWWTLAAAMTLLSVGWPLLFVHWYTTAL